MNALRSTGADPSSPGHVDIRLIDRVDVLKRLFGAIASAPPGRLSIPALRDALVNQADVLRGIETLIAAGELDPNTLRPVDRQRDSGGAPGTAREAPSVEESTSTEAATAAERIDDRAPPPPPAELLSEIEAFCAERGVTDSRFGKAATNDFGLVSGLRKGRQPTAGLVERVRAFIAAPPEKAFIQKRTGRPSKAPEAAASKSPPHERPAPAPRSEGGDDVRNAAAPSIDRNLLLGCFTDEYETLRAIAARFGASGPNKIVRHARTLHERGLVEQLPPANGQPFLLWRRVQRDNRGTSGDEGGGRERAPAVGIANGPIPEREERTPDTAPPASIKPPATPLLDAADRRRLNGQRQQASVRRGQEREATERLDAGKAPRNTFERSVMDGIQRRRDDEARQADPVEQAKLALQRKGRVVYSAIVHGGRRGYFHVGGQRDRITGRLREISPAELIEIAEKATGQSFRRAVG